MLEKVQSLWNFRLIRLSGDDSILVSQVVLVVAILVIGYFARRTSRMPIASNGTLGKRETVMEYGHGTYPDGLCFDEAGGFWVVSLVSNRVIRVAPDGSQTVLLEDVDPEYLDNVEEAFQRGSMGRPHLDNVKSEMLASTSSIAFGGPERRLSYLGCLLDDHIMWFQAPVAGVEPVHWNWRMT